MMKKRLFVGIPLPITVKTALRGIIKKLPDSNIRITPIENLHITICFIGYVEHFHIPIISERIQKTARQMKQFALEFETISFAPLDKPARMVWALLKQHDAFSTLVAGMEKEISRITPINKQYTTPHITLARFKKKPKITLKQARLKPLQVATMSLFESKLSLKGAVYTELQTYYFE